MSIDMEGRVAHLSGDWTVSSLTKLKIELLTDVLQQIGDGHGWKLQVDCREMTATDRAGLELLHVWLQCARFRGFEPELIHMPEKLRLPLQSLAARTGSASPQNFSGLATAPSHQIPRSLFHENRRHQEHRKAA